MRKVYISFLALFLSITGKVFAQLPITYYDIELNSGRNTTGEGTPEQNVNTSGSLAATTGGAYFTGGAGTFNGGSNSGMCLGNSTFGITSATDPKNTASTTSYFTFASSTAGFTGISIAFDYYEQSSSSAYFGINYSTDGGSTWGWLGSQPSS